MYWEITVATAAPAMPNENVTTNKRSSPILSATEIPRKTSGSTEFPILLSALAK